MSRATNTPATRQRRKKWLKLAEGASGGRHRLFKNAKETAAKGLLYAYVGRKQKKRNYRQMWIARINAACRENGISYSRLINGLNLASVQIDRKMLSEIAIHDAAAFTQIVETARQALQTQSPDKTAARQVARI